MAGKSAPAIGIDLGTTYSCVAVWEHDRVEIIANDQGNRTTPSYVAFTDTERFVGDAAKNQAAINPVNTIFGKKMSSKCILLLEIFFFFLNVDWYPLLLASFSIRALCEGNYPTNYTIMHGFLPIED